jgi:hypothetical protein
VVIARAHLLIEANKARRQTVPWKVRSPMRDRPKFRQTAGAFAKELGSDKPPQAGFDRPEVEHAPNPRRLAVWIVAVHG